MGKKSRTKREFRDFVASYPKRPASRAEDLRWGVGWGIAFSAFFSLYVLGISVLVGSAEFRHYGLSLGKIIGIYWAAGVLGGLWVGALRKFAARSPGRARLVGAVTGTIVYGCVMIPLQGLSILSVAVAAVVGMPGGYLVTMKWQRRGMFVPLPPILDPGLHAQWRERQRGSRESRR